MRLDELLQRVDSYCGGQVLGGLAPVEALGAARTRQHPDRLYGEALRMLMDWTGRTQPEHDIARAEAVVALGPLRREYLIDAAPADGLRRVQALIEAIDAAYDDARLDDARGAQA